MCPPGLPPSLWWRQRRERSERPPDGIRARECRQLMLRRVWAELPQLLPIEGDMPSVLVPPLAATGQMSSSSEVSPHASSHNSSRVVGRDRDSNTASLSLASVVDEPLPDLPAWLTSEPSTPQSGFSDISP
ncbi:unnamed protein product [Cladocopium goreaui]|uniref:Ribosome biogenesis protein NSA2 homolog n=1 Tax=Cladocopium goreaui TaxID=2562237 RepID=A0A9P1BL56_9DINO|nr:unnamed protein product [Cladocopium goreaui]|mmetsp:Transcript_73442/g.162205  ORF Transcript_73442/g.162205 Transcript_73442/m.162205 type:complete len:131 (-) Transcript_73442:91-483(-)